jgi:hypothetical protein
MELGRTSLYLPESGEVESSLNFRGVSCDISGFLIVSYGTLTSSISDFKSSNGGPISRDFSLDGATLDFRGAYLDSSLGGLAFEEPSVEIS